MTAGPKFLAKLVERDRLPALHLATPLLDGSHRLGVREDRRRLLQGFVLVHRDKDGRGPTMAGDDDVLAQVGDLIDRLAELTTKLANGDRLAYA